MKLLNKIKSNKQKIVKTIKLIGIIVITIILLAISYSLIFEQDKINIDKYNFKQLEKVKNTLNKLDKYSYDFWGVKEFNNKFNQNIKPIKNCYFIVSKNNYFEGNNFGGGYNFGFKFESVLYKMRYLSWYFMYPKYDLPIVQECIGVCYDILKPKFEYTISNPCQD